jgi:hypothetical protein
MRRTETGRREEQRKGRPMALELLIAMRNFSVIISNEVYLGNSKEKKQV